MKYLHTMIRVSNIDESLRFFCEGLGLKETRRKDSEKGRYTLVFLAAPDDEKAEIELTYNWDGDSLGDGSRNFGHLAYRVENIYETCQRLRDMGYTINRPQEMAIWHLLDLQIKFLLKYFKMATWNQ